MTRHIIARGRYSQPPERSANGKAAKAVLAAGAVATASGVGVLIRRWG